MAISLYRKYRPQTFDDIVGQEHIEQTLRNAVANDTVSHAYLFTGPRGTGKTTTARLLAKALLCEKGPTPNPCGVCEQCEEIAHGTHPDVYELDAASRTGVENVREEIIGRVQFAPTRGRYKVYIIDEVHMLSLAAFNALLKTLEEPPSHVVFILCTTDPQKVPETIQSRCQRFDFHRIPVEKITGNLRYICDKEDFAFDEAALELIAKHSAGGMRDAITALEQLAVFTRGTITFADAEGLLGEVESTELHEIAHLVAARDIAGCFRWVAKFVETGTDIAQFSRSFTSYIRDLYVVSLTGGAAGVEGATAEELAFLIERAQAFGGPDRLSRALLLLGELGAELKTSTDPRLSLEIAFTRMARPDADITLSSLAERVEALEKGVGVVGATSMGQTVPVQAGVSSVPATAKAEAELMPTVSQKAGDAKPAQAGAPKVQENMQVEEAPAEAQAADSASVVSAVLDSSQPLDISAAQRIWAEAANHIKKKRRSLSGVMSSSRILIEGSTLVLELPYGGSFSKKVIEEPENHALVRECLREAAGGDIPFKVMVSQAKPTGVDIPAARLEPRPVEGLRQMPPVGEDPESASEGTLVANGQPREASAPAGRGAKEASQEDYEEYIPDDDEMPPLDDYAPAYYEEGLPAEPRAEDASLGQDSPLPYTAASTQSPQGQSGVEFPGAGLSQGDGRALAGEMSESDYAQMLSLSFGGDVTLTLEEDVHDEQNEE